MQMDRRSDLYVLYRGDVCLGCGTAEELEHELGLKPGSVVYHSYPSVRKRYGSNGLVAVKAGKEGRDADDNCGARISKFL